MPNSTPSKRLGSTARGLGHDHQQHRERLLLRHVDGSLCYWCGRKMFREPKRNPDGRTLHADHSHSRAQYGTSGNAPDRLLHGSCNESRGDGTHDHLRPALASVVEQQPGTESDPALGTLRYFAWPD